MKNAKVTFKDGLYKAVIEDQHIGIVATAESRNRNDLQSELVTNYNTAAEYMNQDKIKKSDINLVDEE